MFGPIYDFAIKPIEVLHLQKIRRKLLSNTVGKTLEIGVGTGLNLSYYPKQIQLTAVEPDASMRKRAIARANALKLNIKVLKVSSIFQLIDFIF